MPFRLLSDPTAQPDQTKDKPRAISIPPQPSPTKSNFRLLSDPTTQPTTNKTDVAYPPTKKKDNFLVGLAKGAVKSAAEVGTSIFNAASTADKLLEGDIEGAGKEIDKKRNIPFLGETKPAFRGDETFGEGVKKMAGYGADLATNFVGGEGVGQIVKQGGKQLVKQAVKTGIKTGAVTGFGQGFGKELEDNGSFVDAFKNGITDAAIGAPIGAVTGFIGGSAANRFKNAGKIAEDKLTKEAIEITRPPLNKKQMTEALRAGRGIDEGILKTTEITPAKRDYEVAKAVEGLVSKKNTSVKNIDNIWKGIKSEAQGLRKVIENQDSIFNVNQISTRLNSHEPPIMLKSDATLNNAYELAKQRFIDLIRKNPKKLSGLLDSRMEFDDMVEKEFGDIFKDPKTSPLKSAIKDMRNIANDYIAEKIPDGNIRGSLRKQSLMYDALDGISEKSTKDVGKNFVQRYMTKHPVVREALKYAVPGGIATYGAQKLLQ